jgi:hypothetical protein
MVNKHLDDIYKDVIEWLKFAEAKNGALLAFNGALLFGVIGLLSNKNKHIENLFPLSFASILLIIISMIILLISFLPDLKAVKRIKNNHPTRLTNYRYYKDIAALRPDAYLKSINFVYCNTEISNLNKGDLDLANQIVILSIIAVRKYKFFTFALILTILAVIFPVISLFFI